MVPTMGGSEAEKGVVLSNQTTMCSAGVTNSREERCQRLTCMLCGSVVKCE